MRAGGLVAVLLCAGLVVCTTAQFAIVDASLCEASCSGHGECQSSPTHDPMCVCALGWGGAICDEQRIHARQILRCKDDCNQHGSCNNGTCVCHNSWTGPSCAISTCPQGCFHGVCNLGVCLCEKGYTGPACDGEACDPPCLHGVCQNGSCVCDIYYQGQRCDMLRCPRDCLGNGKCLDGECLCFRGWSGVDCSINAQQQQCSPPCEHGICDVWGVCKCEKGFFGKACQFNHPCPENCSFHGNCIDDECRCDFGYSGEACEERLLSPPHHGKVVRGVTVCDSGWAPPLCATRLCLDDCNHHGDCIEGMCVCDDGYSGSSCQEQLILHGKIVDGVVLCAEGWTGKTDKDCDMPACSSGCVHGRCVDGICHCLPGWEGLSCEQLGCPNSCSGHGACHDGLCECNDGWMGISCAHLTCPENCNGNGYCLSGDCSCFKGWTGDACSQQVCENSCLGRGPCVNGTCNCTQGFYGEDCSYPGGFVQAHGACFNGTCVCIDGWYGNLCHSQCPFACNEHGICHNDTRACLCDLGWAGDHCDQVDVCSAACHGNGRCVEEKCMCEGAWEEPWCEIRPLPSGHGALVSRLVSGTQNSPLTQQYYSAYVRCDTSWSGHHDEVVDPSLTDSDLSDFCDTKVCPKRDFQSDCVEHNNDGYSCDNVTTSNFDDCYSVACPNDCTGNGVCEITGTCRCDPGFFENDCSISYLPRGGHGHLVHRWMVVDPGFDSASLSAVLGSTVNMTEINDALAANETVRVQVFDVVCDPGFSLPYCLAYECAGNCSFPNGHCESGVCKCAEGKIGDACQLTDPTYNPQKEGCYCIPLTNTNSSAATSSNADGTAPPPATGEEPATNAVDADNCEWICPFNVSDGRESVDLFPRVEFEFREQNRTGGDLTNSFSEPVAAPLCPGNCSGHGTCDNRKCHCFKGWFGLTCGFNRTDVIYTCDPPAKCKVQNCHEKGVCVLDPFMRAALTREEDYDDTTINGICECVPGYNASTHCEFPSCPYCHERGYCMQSNFSACFCDSYWYGMYCENVRPTADLWFRSEFSAQIDGLYAHSWAVGETKDVPLSAYLIGGTGMWGATLDVFRFVPEHGFKLLGELVEIPKFPATKTQQFKYYQLSRTKPAVREGLTTVFYSADEGQTGYIFMFGGQGWKDSADPVSGVALAREPLYPDDVWKFDVRAEHWELVNAPAPPIGRTKHAMDMAAGVMVVFGGARYHFVGPEEAKFLRATNEHHALIPKQQYLNDVWIFNPKNNRWKGLKVTGTVPQPRCGHTMHHIPGTTALAIFGGMDGVSHFGDVWVLHLDKALKATFTLLDTVSDVASLRHIFFPGVITGDPDSTEYKKLLALGEQPEPSPSPVAKIEEPPAYKSVPSTPTSDGGNVISIYDQDSQTHHHNNHHHHHAAAFVQTKTPVHVNHHQSNHKQPTHPTHPVNHKLRPAAFLQEMLLEADDTEQQNTTKPAPRAFHVSAMTPGRELVISFGETEYARLQQDSWTYSFDTLAWTQKAVEPAGHGFPISRNLASAAFYNDKMIVFGGVDAHTNVLDDVWIMDLSPDLNVPSLTKPDNWKDLLKAADKYYNEKLKF